MQIDDPQVSGVRRPPAVRTAARANRTASITPPRPRLRRAHRRPRRGPRRRWRARRHRRSHNRPRRYANRVSGKTRPTPSTCSTASKRLAGLASSHVPACCPLTPDTGAGARCRPRGRRGLAGCGGIATCPSVADGRKLLRCDLEIHDSVALAHQGLDVGVCRSAHDLETGPVDTSDRCSDSPSVHGPKVVRLAGASHDRDLEVAELAVACGVA